MARKWADINQDMPAQPVRRTIATPAPPEEVWRALTDAPEVAQWFGLLTPGLVEGGKAWLDFGDGDFFELEAIHLERPHLLRYIWRFLGIGARDTITWRVIANGSGSLVTVTDSEPERSPEWVEELEAGWLDFTQRLERFLQTRTHNRYDWSREIHAGIELDCAVGAAGRALFASAHEGADWLPFSGGAWPEGGTVTVKDELEPAHFTISEVISDDPSCLQFKLNCNEWLNPTRCFLELLPRNGGSMFTLRHSGWEAIDFSGEEQRRQRKRFCGLWIAALKNARRLVADHSSFLP